MSRTKEVGTAVGTLACALAIGFAMQNTETASQRYGALNDTTSSQAVAAATIPTSAVTSKPTMEVQEITPTSALDKDAMPSEPAPKGFLARLFGASPAEAAEPAAPTPAVVQSVEPAPAKEDAIVENLEFAEDRAEPQVVEIVETTETVETPGHICDIVANARPSASAFVTLSVTAGCDPNTSVTVHHNGMQFSALTDNVGAFTVDVPALSASAVFIVEVEPGRGAVAQAVVEDLARFNRVVVQWQGQSGFELHAREFNAEYGSDGHVWYGADADTARLETGAGGYLVRLGGTATEDALMADVYTFPAAMSARNGQVDLSVEAVVTQSNCGQMIEAQTLELRDNSDLRTQSVTLAVPGCDAIGNFMVLNTLLDDLQIAAR